MNFTKVLTSQNVVVGLNSNILGWRILSFFIDTAILGVYGYLVVKFIDSFYIEDNSFHRRTEFLYSLLFLPVLLYSLLTEFLLDGRTLGKLICGIRVVKINGLKCGFSEYLMRWLFRILDIYPGIFFSLFFGQNAIYIGISLTGIPALFSILSSKNHQRFGDKAAGTTVIKVKNKASLSKTIFKEISDDYQPTFSQVIKLSDNDMRIIKDTYTMSKEAKNSYTINQLRKKVESVMQVESSMEDEEFINTVIDDFNHYTKSL